MRITVSLTSQISINTPPEQGEKEKFDDDGTKKTSWNILAHSILFWHSTFKRGYFAFNSSNLKLRKYSIIGFLFSLFPSWSLSSFFLSGYLSKIWITIKRFLSLRTARESVIKSSGNSKEELFSFNTILLETFKNSFHSTINSENFNDLLKCKWNK